MVYMYYSFLSLVKKKKQKKTLPTSLIFYFIHQPHTYSRSSPLHWKHSFRTAGLLCPWDFPGKNTGMGCRFLLQGICLTQDPAYLSHWQRFFTAEPPRKPSDCSWSKSESVGLAVVSDSLDPVDCSRPGSSVHGILQARILEWIAIPFSRRSSWPRNQTWVSCISGRFFTIWATREAPDCSYSALFQASFMAAILLLEIGRI